MKHYLLALVIVIGAFVSADAATLFGKVIEVNSGDVITIYNLNRPVRVKLMGVDAPEMNQSFGDVAQKHLADLVFEKSVVVEYAGIAADSSLTGRVLLNDADIGAQMIRDGAAWFDPSNGRLNPSDRDVYEESEQAARSEKRGLWRQENPVAPWEFVRAEKMRANTATSSKTTVTETKPRRSGPVPELTNLSLMAARTNVASAASSSGSSDAWARSTARRSWSRFQPDGAFSVEMPEGGERETVPDVIGGEPIEMTMYMARDGWAIYGLAWFDGPTLGETDEQAINGLSKKIVKRAAEEYQRGKTQAEFDCKPLSQKSVSQNGYTGIEYDVTACSVPMRVRIYTKIVDNRRYAYMGFVAYSEDEGDNVSRFLKSFTVGTAKKRTR